MATTDATITTNVTSGGTITSNLVNGGTVSSNVITGAQGLTGPQGPPGSGDKNYVQAFTTVSSVTVPHNLGKYPATTIIDSAGDEVEGDIVHNTINQLTVNFSAVFSGTIFCN